MPLDLTSDCTFTGPALPEPFVKFNLETELNRRSLLPKAVGPEARALNDQWDFVRRKLRNLVTHGGPLPVQTREGDEDGTARLRAWRVDLDADLDAPARRSLAYRFSHARIAVRCSQVLFDFQTTPAFADSGQLCAGQRGRMTRGRKRPTSN